MGLAFTFLYVAALVLFIYLGPQWGILKVSPLSLNELGDLCAGIVGPLTLFWLVLGFLQQATELRLQVHELKLSVDQQRELLNVSKETLSHEKAVIDERERKRRTEIQPKIFFPKPKVSAPEMINSRTFAVQAENVGHQLKNVTVSSELSDPKESGVTNYWTPGTTIECGSWIQRYADNGPKPKNLTIFCTDDDEQEHEIRFRVQPSGPGIEVHEISRNLRPKDLEE